ncbi:MAG: carboxymuconolactone decarboxylase family protein [Methyloligellaceae bacterium]
MDAKAHDKLFERGLEKRKATLGAEYVEKALANADAFNRPFQELVTAYCWGFAWGDDALNEKTRSMLNLAMIAALNRMHEWELHLRGALRNGVSRDEIQAILHQIAIYCGIPVGVECFRIANRVFAELDQE